jgi:hypothetical protein
MQFYSVGNQEVIPLIQNQLNETRNPAYCEESKDASIPFTGRQFVGN